MQEQIEKEKRFKQQKDSFYNMIIQINSMDQLINEGWPIKVNAKTDIKDYLQKDVSVVSILGNKNSGKSFLLHLLAHKEIPNGFTVTTEGLSFIIPDNAKNKDDNVILIDTAGTESPLLVDIDKMKKEEKAKISIEKLVNDRHITDYFIQKFILEKSYIFICVVENLTLTAQKFINRIIKYYANKKIFIVHNLKTFIQRNQVEEYIKDTLLQSLTFDLEKEKYYSLETPKKGQKEQNQYYYKQKLKDNKTIIHLIIANQNSDAGKFYNPFAIDYINSHLTLVKVKKPFNIIKNLKDFLVSISGDIFKNKIEANQIEEGEKIIKVNTDKLELKNCSIDQLGNNIIIDEIFKPKYRFGFYVDKKNKQNKLSIEIELFSKWKIEQNIIPKDSDFIIYIKGKKEKDIKQKQYISKNYIPGNEFDLELKIKNSKGFLNEPSLEEINGLYILNYTIRETQIEDEIKIEEAAEDEEI